LVFFWWSSLGFFDNRPTNVFGFERVASLIVDSLNIETEPPEKALKEFL